MNPATIFLAGFSHPRGHHLTLALERSSVAVKDLHLYDPPPAGALTQFRGEAKLVQPIPEDDALQGLEDLHSADLVFLCGSRDEMEPLQLYCGEQGIRAWSLSPPGPNAPPTAAVMDSESVERATAGGASLLYLPSPPAMVAWRLSRALGLGSSLEGASIMAFLPASATHREGPRELMDQSLALMNMESPPVEHLGQPRAFDLVPSEIDSWLLQELQSVLNLPAGAARAVSIAAPLFHGYGLSVEFELARDVETNQIHDLLDAAGMPDSHGLDASPCSAAQAGEIRVHLLSARGNRVWLWAAFDPDSAGIVDEALSLAQDQLGGAWS